MALAHADNRPLLTLCLGRMRLGDGRRSEGRDAGLCPAPRMKRRACCGVWLFGAGCRRGGWVRVQRVGGAWAGVRGTREAVRWRGGRCAPWCAAHCGGCRRVAETGARVNRI